MAAEAGLTGVIIARPDNANADIAKIGLNICLIWTPSKVDYFLSGIARVGGTILSRKFIALISVNLVLRTGVW